MMKSYPRTQKGGGSSGRSASSPSPDSGWRTARLRSRPSRDQLGNICCILWRKSNAHLSWKLDGDADVTLFVKSPPSLKINTVPTSLLLASSLQRAFTPITWVYFMTFSKYRSASSVWSRYCHILIKLILLPERPPMTSLNPPAGLTDIIRAWTLIVM